GVGLSCGGTIHVFLERMTPKAGRQLLDSLGAAIAANRAVALVTVVAGKSGIETGAKVLVFEDERVSSIGSSGDRTVDAETEREARATLGRGTAERHPLGGIDVFIQSFFPPPVLYVIGAVHPAAELCQAAKLVGF